MRYIIMCGATYEKWEKPRQTYEIKGEAIVARTIRLLKEAGVEDIAISSTNSVFNKYGVPVLTHNNPYTLTKDNIPRGYWVDAFYPVESPVCYLFGDVVYSPDAIRKIVNTRAESIKFFASAPPFSPAYTKRWAEPFAFKVTDTKKFRDCIDRVKLLCYQNKFNRHPISWELWQVIEGTELNKIDYTNYDIINDYTCDVDNYDDLKKIEEKMYD